MLPPWPVSWSFRNSCSMDIYLKKMSDFSQRLMGLCIHLCPGSIHQWAGCDLWRNEDVPSRASHCGRSTMSMEYFISVILLNKKRIILENKETPLWGSSRLIGVYFFFFFWGRIECWEWKIYLLAGGAACWLLAMAVIKIQTIPVPGKWKRGSYFLVWLPD